MISSNNGYERQIGKILFNENSIDTHVTRLADEISSDYIEINDLILICVLKGAAIFLADILRKLKIPVTIDYMAISSYEATKSTGIVRLIKDLDVDIKDKHVLIIEDIVDTGLTLNYLIKNLKTREPKTVEVCTLLDRPRRRIADINIKYVGFEIPDMFVIGYGLDYNGYYRQLPYIAELNAT